jgi:hypothetical protein
MTKKKGSPVLRRRSPAWVQEHRLDRIEELKHPVVIPPIRTPRAKWTKFAIGTGKLHSI